MLVEIIESIKHFLNPPIKVKQKSPELPAFTPTKLKYPEHLGKNIDIKA